MTNYIFIEDNKIVGKGQAKCLNDEVLNIEVSKEIYNEIDKYIYKDGTIVLNPDYEKEQEVKEKEKINNLTMTALDFIGVLKSFGLTSEVINSYLEANLDVKMQLTYCNSVYCGVAKSFMPISVGDITITEDMIEEAFKRKNGEYRG